MASYPNRLFHGWCSNNGNSKSHFRHYIIDTVQDINDYDGNTIRDSITHMEDYYVSESRIGEPYYIVYGSFKLDFDQSSKVIGTFDTLKEAIELVEHMSGNTIQETELPVYK